MSSQIGAGVAKGRSRGRSRSVGRLTILALGLLIALVLSATANAADDPQALATLSTASPAGVHLDLIWAFVAGSLILLMQLGFAMVTTGLTRAKNAAHTATAILVGLAIAALGFWACGFALGGGGTNLGNDGRAPGALHLGGRVDSLFGTRGFFPGPDSLDAPGMGRFLLLFGFAAATATIPAGALAERWRFRTSIVSSLIVSILIFPIYACWAWGGGWLADLGRSHSLGHGYIDYAGASVVHLIGGLVALAGAIVLGPRIGKFRDGGGSNPIPGHNIPMVVFGTILLAVTWLAYCAGRSSPGSDVRLALVAVNVLLAASAGLVTSLLVMWGLYGKPDPTMACNGLLGGAVAISAACAFVGPAVAVLLGGTAGVLVIASVLGLERRLRIDDPAGVISVHGLCGAFGAVAVGFLADGSFGSGWNGVVGPPPLGLFYSGSIAQVTAQVIGVAAAAAWAFPVAYLVFFTLHRTIGLRVTPRDEVAGLDIAELGVYGYLAEDSLAIQQAGYDRLADPTAPPGA
jgi:Amt family ammonium transporter